ncbi:hypothetical protein [Glaciecola sp. SC05]|uniref:hypothetical protein n=1 Tax=Glaciecola sp. SC05 TaxID=1987355 RepID=UPI0035270319
MSELSEVLGALMVNLVHARRMADEETAAVAEYYKDNPLLEGMSLPRVRVPELTIDMPLTFDKHTPAKDAQLNTPSVIHKSLMDQFKASIADEEITTDTKKFQAVFDKEARLALQQISDNRKNGDTRVTKEAVLRGVDNAFAKALKKSAANKEIPFENSNSVNKAIRHRVAQVALKTQANPISLEASATTSAVKENSTAANSVRLHITLREEGLEWATSAEDGKLTHRLQPE